MVCASPDADVPVMSTSTLDLGCMKPPTALPSLTRTDTARMPDGIIDGRPDPPFSAARFFPAMKNSPCAMGSTAPRPRSRFLLPNPFGGSASDGIWIMRTSLS